MKLISIILALIMLQGFVAADSSAIMFEDLGVSAESIAAGGVEGAIEGSASILENPALLGHDYSLAVDVFQTTLLEEITYNTVSVSKAFPRFSLGIGYLSTKVTGIPKTDLNSDNFFEQVGTYSYSFSQYNFGGCYKLTNFLILGATVKYRVVTLDDISGSGSTIDFGAKYTTYGVDFTGHLSNVWISKGYINYDNGAQEKLPLKAIVGVKTSFYRIQPMLQYQLTLDGADNRSGLFNLGVKWTPFKNKMLTFLAGYRQMQELDSVLNRFAVGVNIHLSIVSFSYAYEQIDRDFYNTGNYFSLGVKFD